MKLIALPSIIIEVLEKSHTQKHCSMKSREYEVTINKDSTLSLKLNFEPFLNSHYDFIYDKKGFLTNKKAYFARKDSLVTAEIWDYVYDKKHRIITI